ncbi:hypothetical protein ACM6PT_24730, partial [Klebsiella pneumoniae]
WPLPADASAGTPLQISVISVLIADVVAGRGLPNVFRRALLDRLPAEFCLIRRGTER